MTDRDHHDLVGAYATDAVDADERSQIEAHLASCVDCRAELAAYREVLAALATRAVAPPPGLEDAVVSAVRRSSPGPATGRPLTSPPTEHRHRRRGRRPVMVLAAAAAAAGVFTVGGVVGRATAPEPTTSASNSGMDAVLAVAAADDAAFLPANVMGTSVRLVVSDEMGKAALLAADMPTPAKGECYQVWRVAPDGTKTSAGLFIPDADGRVAVMLDASENVQSFVITTEPPGGSSKPTGHMVGQVVT